MENLTYNLYRANPNFRKELEAEASRLRHEAVREFVVMPFVRLYRWLGSIRFHSAVRNTPKSV